MKTKLAEVVPMPVAPPPAEDSAEETLVEIAAAEFGNAEVQVHLASGGRTQAVPNYQQLVMSPPLAKDFAEIAGLCLAQLKEPAIDVRTYEATVGLAPNQVEAFDLDLLDHEFVRDQLAPLWDPGPKPAFVAQDPFLSELRFYAISLYGATREPVFVYRSYTPKLELERSRFIGAMLAGDKFVGLKTKLLLFDRQADCLSCGRWMFIFSKDRFHQIFRFFDYVKKEAQQTLTKLSQQVPIRNFKLFRQEVQSDAVRLTKVHSIARRPYLRGGKIPMDQVRRVIDDFGLEIQIAGPPGGEELVYESGKIWEFLRLLDDDYLVSEMTGRSYEAISKRPRGKRRSPKFPRP